MAILLVLLRSCFPLPPQKAVVAERFASRHKGIIPSTSFRVCLLMGAPLRFKREKRLKKKRESERVSAAVVYPPYIPKKG